MHPEEMFATPEGAEDMGMSAREAAKPVSETESAHVSDLFKQVLENQGVDLAKAILKNTDAVPASQDAGVRVEVPGDLSLMDVHLNAADIPNRLDVQGNLTIHLADLKNLNGKFVDVRGAIEVIVNPGLTAAERQELEDKVLTMNGVMCGSVKILDSKFAH